MKKAKDFFTDEEKTKISEATKLVEARTSGEIAVMVVDSSEQYRDAEILGGILLGSVLAFILTETLFEASLWYYIPLSILCYIPLKWLAASVPELKAGFTGKNRRNEAVRQRAVRAFYEKGLYRTRDNTGVLFFISLLERKVWVLADKGIYEKMQQETLNGFAEKVTKGIKEGHAAEALCSVISEAGTVLAKHFPIKADDTNELSNEVMTE